LHNEEHHLPYTSPDYYSGDQIKDGELGCGMWHTGGRGEVHTRYWQGDLMERHCLKDLGIDGKSRWKQRVHKGLCSKVEPQELTSLVPVDSLVIKTSNACDLCAPCCVGSF
jgi:hypothetical protein